VGKKPRVGNTDSGKRIGMEIRQDHLNRKDLGKFEKGYEKERGNSRGGGGRQMNVATHTERMEAGLAGKQGEILETNRHGRGECQREKERSKYPKALT